MRSPKEKEGARHLNHDSARPFRMPPHRRADHRKSYRISDVIFAILCFTALAAILWGYSLAYNFGYDTAESYYMEVRHERGL